MTDDFCATKPQPGVWSIHEVLEHLIILETRIDFLLKEKLPAGELTGQIAPERQAKDVKLWQMVTSRGTKVTAPQHVCPSGKYSSCKQALADFHVARQATIEFARHAPVNLRERTVPHPIAGPIDGHQWLIVLAAHTERHIRQIEDMKTAMAAHISV